MFYELKEATMTTSRLVRLVLCVVLALVWVNCDSAESAKKATESHKEAINTTPPSMESVKKSFEEDRIKKTVDGFFNELDTDKDKKVSHDEFMVPMEGRFKGIDTNHDGFITRQEFEISFKKHREMKMNMMRSQPRGKMPPNN
jgi:hypothetical protein